MKIINLYIVLIGLILVSCTEALNQKPWGVALEDEFYKTQADAILAIDAAYTPLSWLQDAFDSNMASLDCSSDDVFKGGGHAGDQSALTEFSLFRITSSNTIIANRWKNAYQGIFRVNKVLDNIPNIAMDEDLKSRILGEAHFLRAYFYFELMVQFGGVVKIEKALKPGEYNLSRSTQAEIEAFIEHDLEIAASLLPKKSEYNQDKELGRATKGAAIAYLIKLNAMKQDWAQVVKDCNRLFNLNEYELVSNYGDIFQPTGEHCKESIFEVNYGENSIAGWGSRNPGSWTAVSFTPRTQNGAGFCQVTTELANSYEQGDPRKDLSIYEFVSNDYGTNLYNRKYSCAPYSDYPWPVNGVSHGGVNTRLVRLADIYLLYAEAEYHLANEDKAREYVNKVRKRARGGNNNVLPDITETGNSLLTKIYHERRVELAGEGIRFWDLVRTGRAAKVLKDKGFIEGVSELRPLPNKDVQISNGLLVQNPGY
ncbi:RagB/SusD family nutrient uptake outer membrane protein [Persicobacter psychrovividus]|uniref:Membrane protein n=1 Tax=Persicobacter psychrovividus TaxID=387638 RepID=A0ABN6LGU8_9BACT|nr:membrane protein [Persicobacter psychrovividus]